MIILYLALFLFLGFIVFYFAYTWFGILGVIISLIFLVVNMCKEPKQNNDVDVNEEDMFYTNQGERVKNITIKK